MSYYLFLNELNNKKCFIYLFIFIITNDKMYKKKSLFYSDFYVYIIN